MSAVSTCSSYYEEGEEKDDDGNNMMGGNGDIDDACRNGEYFTVRWLYDHDDITKDECDMNDKLG